MNILIRGVRNNIHSVSMVNQFLLLSWQGKAGVNVLHEDLSSRWPAGDCGFDQADREAIQRFPSPKGDEPCDILVSYDQHDLIDERIDPDKRYLFVVTEFGRFQREGQAVIQAQLDQGAHVLTPSQWSAQRLIDRFGSGVAPQIEVIAHGVHPKYYWPMSPEQCGAARAPLGIGPDEFVFMNLGAGTWNKGIDLVLKGFDQVIASGRPARLILKDMRQLYGNKVDDQIGGMIQRGEISSACTDKIVYCPGQLSLPQMGTLYNLADCYLSPYRAEGFNLPVLEALACGTPVIATRDGATKDFADSSVAFGIEGQLCELTPEQGRGCYIEPLFDHFVSLMNEAVDQNLKRARRFAPGLATVPERFGWDAIGRRHIEIFTKAGH